MNAFPQPDPAAFDGTCPAIDAGGHECACTKGHKGAHCSYTSKSEPHNDDWIYVMTDPAPPEAIELGRRLWDAAVARGELPARDVGEQPAGDAS